MKYNFTIITPSLNSANVLQKCIDSVKSQKEVSINHIIVDGGSSDGTIKILQRNKCNFHVVEGSSIYEALNYGYQHSNSDLVGFLNCDDFYCNDFVLKEIYLNYKKNKLYDIFYGDCRFVNIENKLLYKLKSPKKHSFLLEKKRMFSISHPCWFIKHEKFKENGLYNTKYKYVSDCDFIIRALKKRFNFYYVNIYVTNFLIHNNNASSSRKAKNESYELIKNYNNLGYLSIFIHKILLILLYLKDPNYFIYRLKRII